LVVLEEECELVAEVGVVPGRLPCEAEPGVVGAA
jgi:hypothetical protein